MTCRDIPRYRRLIRDNIKGTYRAHSRPSSKQEMRAVSGPANCAAGPGRLGLGAGNREAMQKSGMREKTDRKDLGEPSQGQPTG